VIARIAVVMLIGCAAHTPVPQPVPRLATVEIAATSCVPAPAVEQRISEVVAAHQAKESGLAISVSEQSGEASTDVGLRIVRPSGELALDRHFTLGALDCASAAQVLALAVDRWLSEFPEWAAPPPPPPPPPARWNELHAIGALSSMWMPLGVDGQLGALVDRGPRGDRFGVSLLVRASVPQAAGNGRFQQTSFLAGATWRHTRGPWISRIELRGGALLVSGTGFTDNGRDWLPWWEVALFGGHTLGRGALGLELAATALQHRAVTSDGLVSEDIPFLRIGVGGMFGTNR
jgi:hypothetical protein